jgi:hypothetical protein
MSRLFSLQIFVIEGGNAWTGCPGRRPPCATMPRMIGACHSPAPRSARSSPHSPLADRAWQALQRCRHWSQAGLVPQLPPAWSCASQLRRISE